MKITTGNNYDLHGLVDEFYKQRNDNKGKQYTIEFVNFLIRNNIPPVEYTSTLQEIRGQLGRKYKRNTRKDYHPVTKQFVEYTLGRINTPVQIPSNPNGIQIHNNIHELKSKTRGMKGT